MNACAGVKKVMTQVSDNVSEKSQVTLVENSSQVNLDILKELKIPETVEISRVSSSCSSQQSLKKEKNAILVSV